uniref:Secreted and transmembrane 1A n=1 Tax=Peromyscus maniculatus bairdii TaxID=230844 RepID=A0A8C8W3A0_PERMB
MKTRPSVSIVHTPRMFSILLLAVSLNAQNEKPSNKNEATDTRLSTSPTGTTDPRSPSGYVRQCLT